MQNDGPALYEFGVTILMPTQNLQRLILGYVNDDLTAKAKLIKCGNDDGTGDGSGNEQDILMLAVIVMAAIVAATSTVAATVMMVHCGWLHWRRLR